MVLTPTDVASAVWQSLETYLCTRLEDLRAKNDGPMSEDARNKLIGQIHEIKALLALREPPPIL
jgi:hypothetical protein